MILLYLALPTQICRLCIIMTDARMFICYIIHITQIIKDNQLKL